jgi:hypothetical protein
LFNSYKNWQINIHKLKKFPKATATAVKPGKAGTPTAWQGDNKSRYVNNSVMYATARCLNFWHTILSKEGGTIKSREVREKIKETT